MARDPGPALLLRQGMRYLIAGGVVFACDFLVFAMIVFVVPGLLIPANIAGKIAGAGLGFVLHRNWTFAGTHRDSAARQIISYVLLLGFNMVASSSLLWLGVVMLHLWAPLAKLIADVLVIAVAFVAGRTLVFRPDKEARNAWQ